MKSKIKYIQSLSQKKLREEQGVFVAEGPKIIEELLQAPNVELKELFAISGWIEQNADWQQRLGQNLVEISDDDLKRISSMQTPHQVLGVFQQPVFAPLDTRNKVSLMLDAIQDPGNMGSIIRCADWFGIDRIICSTDCVEAFNSKVVQSTMGSISRVQVIYEDLLAFTNANANIPIYAATLRGASIYRHPMIREGFILVGNESKGIQPELLSQIKFQITIPKKGNAESLNAAVATGIILSHLI